LFIVIFPCFLFNTNNTCSRNWRHKSPTFSDAGFWYVLQIWTGFVWCQILAPIRTLFYCKPESGYNTGHNNSGCPANSSPTSLLVTFIFGARNFHSRHICYEKLAPENGVDLWRRFLEHVLCVLIHIPGHYSPRVILY